MYWFVGRTGPVRTRDFYQLLAPFVFSSVAGILACLAFRHFFNVGNPVLGLAVCGSLIAVSNLLALLRLLPDERPCVTLRIRFCCYEPESRTANWTLNRIAGARAYATCRAYPSNPSEDQPPNKLCVALPDLSTSGTRANTRVEDERAQILESMCRVITHRGPDDQGVMLKPGVALGMRRLVDHRSRRAVTNQFRTKTTPSPSSSTARSTTTANCKMICSRAVTRSEPIQIPKRSFMLMKSLERPASSTCAACLPLRFGTTAKQTFFIARDRVGQEATLLLRDARRHARFWLGAKVAAGTS